MEKLITELDNIFLTKSERISLETSWLLKFEIWRFSVSINYNCFRYLNQVSHRNNQPLPFFNILTCYEVWYLSSDIPLSISTNILLPERVDLWHMSYTENDISSVNYTLFPPEPNDVICCLLLSSVFDEPNFNSILGVEIKCYGGAYPIPSLNHSCSTHSRLNLLSIHDNWKIIGINFFRKLKIDGNLVVKSKLPPSGGSVALRQLNLIHKKGP